MVGVEARHGEGRVEEDTELQVVKEGSRAVEEALKEVLGV